MSLYRLKRGAYDRDLTVGASLLALLALVYITGCTSNSPNGERASTQGGTSIIEGGALAPGGNEGGALNGGEMMTPNGGADQGGADQGGADQGGADQGGADQGGGIVPECDFTETLALYGCSDSGCHAAPIQASLDLISDGFEARLVNAPSNTPGCESRVLIDSQAPAKSLILQAIGVVDPPLGTEDTCQLVMPPQGELSVDDKQCLTDWLNQVVETHGDVTPMLDFEPTPLFSAVRKVKTLVHGEVPTFEEVSAIESDPSALRGLIEEWLETDRAREKLLSFFQVSLQQRIQEEDIEQFDRLRRHRSFNAPFRAVMEESFARTALDLIERDQPFTQVATTRQWMVTTANLILLLYPDQSANQRQQRHIFTPTEADAPSTLARQVTDRTWHIPSLPGVCDVPQTDALEMLFGFGLRRYCGTPNNIRFNDTPLTQEDFTDWRMVTFSRQINASEEELIPFYDLPRLREATAITSRLPRLGFFTTSAFFNNWATNVDNQFRVVTNQTLLAALHIGFSSTEPTEPLLDEGLDAEHASEESCFGCHRQLDPMRTYFGRSFNINYQLPTNAPDEGLLFESSLTSSFAFRGVTDEGGNIGRLGSILADHPRFAPAWVQKLCLYANSTRCDESDPAFIEISTAFREGGFNFKDLIVDLFSSPLVTHLHEPESLQGKDPIISITRREHLCAILTERTGVINICESNRARNIIGLIPRDDFSRGAVDPTQPSLPSAFHYAAVENLCEAVARLSVTNSSERFPAGNTELTLPRIVSQLMGIPMDHERYEETLQVLTDHHQIALTAGLNQRDATRSVFTIACLSPDVMGIGL